MPTARHFLFCCTFLALFLGRECTQAALNPQEEQVFDLMQHASGQRRASLTVDPILSRVARARAEDMAKRDYFGHVNPDGYAANYLVRQAGYSLPSSYPTADDANTIESIAAGYSTASAVWNGWMGSPSHKKHLLAEDPFFAAQTAIGVGYYYDASSEYQHYWCVLSAPPDGPSLSISSPAADATVSTPAVTFTGIAGGTPLPARIVYRVENAGGTGAFAPALGTQTWSAAVQGFTPGTNTVRIRSLDSTGATIMELTRVVRYAILKPLVVSLAGGGTVSAGFLGTTSREVGRSYTLVARPSAGWIFDHWSGRDSANPSLTFTMVAGLHLTAHFRVSPFLAWRGTYNGLAQDESPTFQDSGFLKLTLNVAGGFTGRFALAGKSYALRGTFDASGQAQLSLPRAHLDPLLLVLNLDFASDSPRLTGTVTAGATVIPLSAERALAATETHFAAGRYTLVIAAAEVAGAPQGNGHGLVTVSRTGVARLAGTLADGRNLTSTAALSAEGRWPIYVPLLAGTGSVGGSVSFATGSDHEPSGTLHWSKPARPQDRYQPAAVEVDCPVAGSSYLPPARGTPVLDVPLETDNTELMLSAGNLAQTVEQTATLQTDNKVFIASPALPNLKLTVSAATGRFSGSFLHPLTLRSSRISGVVLQNQNAAFGFFLGQSASGSAEFAPRP